MSRTASSFSSSDHCTGIKIQDCQTTKLKQCKVTYLHVHISGRIISVWTFIKHLSLILVSIPVLLQNTHQHRTIAQSAIFGLEHGPLYCSQCSYTLVLILVKSSTRCLCWEIGLRMSKYSLLIFSARESWQLLLSLWAGFYAVAPPCKLCQFSQQYILLIAHTFTHNPIIVCTCVVSLSTFPGLLAVPDRWRRWIVSQTSASSCLEASRSACVNWAKLMQQLSLSNGRKCVHIAGADGQVLYPASCPAHFSPSWCAMLDHTLHWKGKRRRRWRWCVWGREKQQFQFSTLSTNSKNRWILKQKSI